MRHLNVRPIDLDILREKYLPQRRASKLRGNGFELDLDAPIRPRASITNGFPVSGGSGSVSATESACTEATGTDAAPEAGGDDDDGGDGDGDPDGRHTPSPSPLRASRATRQKTGVTLPPENADCELWRLPTVLKRIPVSRTGWLAGVKSGLYPKPLKIGLRAVAWRASDIRALVASL